MHGQDTSGARRVNGGDSEPRIKAKEIIRGRELDLLQHFGVGWPVHGAPHVCCPFPEHKDADPSWRWDSSKARWFCTCGSGDALDALQRINGWDFAEACAYVETVFSGAGVVSSPFKGKDPRPRSASLNASPAAVYGDDDTTALEAARVRKAVRARTWWEGAGDIEGPALAYLRDVRKITLERWPETIRFANALPYRDDKTKAVNCRPAIIAAMSRAPGGPVQAINRLWLADDGQKAKVSRPKKTFAPTKGLACWIGEPSMRLVVFDGMEDAVSGFMAGGRFCCATMGVANIENLALPAGVTEAVIFADRAKDGSEEAYSGEQHITRAKAAWEAAGVTVRVVLAPHPHKDANDVLRAEGPEAVRRVIDGEDESGEAKGEDGADRREADGGEGETFSEENEEAQAEGDRRAALETAVAELTKIAPVEFALAKGERAKALGVSKADLTRLVNAARKEATKKERARRVAGGLDWPETKNTGEPCKRSQENILFFFAHCRIELSFDLMANMVRINRGGETLELTDPVANQMWLEADALGLHADEGYFMKVLENTARQNSFHPLRDYLDSLEWDGKPRLDTWLTDYMGAEDTELHRAFGRKHLIGAVRRIQRPGAKYDTILIFQGIQGQGKSSFIRALSPSDEYFSDAMKIGADIQEIMEVCSGKWLIEIPELDGMGRKDAASIKAMLSRQIDEARMAYGRYKTRIPRQFVMFGSVNDSNFLQDATGNRRFWPVTVKPTEVAETIVARLVANRDQLWAEAAYYESQGESVVLPKPLWEAAAEAQQARMVIDPWAEKLEAYLTSHPGFVPTDDVYVVLGVSGDKQNVISHRRVCGVLSSLGYNRVRRTLGEKRVWGYANCDDACCPE